MKAKVGFLAIFLFMGCVTVHAQGTDLVVGYSFGQLEAGATSASNTSNGMTVSISKNFGPYFSFTTDYGANFGNAKDLLVTLTPLRSFTTQQLFVGPQINIRTKRWNVFLRALGGFVQQDLGGFSLTPAECAGAGIDCSLLPGSILLPSGSFQLPSTSIAKFAMNYGTGIDLYASRHFGFRAVQLDYMPVRSTDPNRNWRQNVRVSSGLVFRF